MNIKKLKRKMFYTKKAKSKRYPAETIIDADYIDALALLANTPAQAESLLHSKQQEHWPLCELR